MPDPTEPQIIAVYTVPRPTEGRRGTVNGETATDADWQRIWASQHRFDAQKRAELIAAGLREVDAHDGGFVVSVRVPAGPLDAMAAAAVTLLRPADTITEISAEGRLAAVHTTGPLDADARIYVLDPNPGRY
jgi:carbon monoxide dehydrogenase subunit G